MTYNYTTPELVRVELKGSTPFDANTFPTLATCEQWISQDSEAINDKAGSFIGLTAYEETIDYNGQDSIFLKNTPIVGEVEVLYSPSNIGSPDYSLSDTKVEDVHFVLYREGGELEPIFNNWNPKVGNKRLKVTYNAGYDPIPGRITKLATKMVAKRVIDAVVQQDIAEKQSGKSISIGSVQIVKPSNFGVQQYTIMNEEIKQLSEDLVGNFSVHRYGMRY